MATTLFYDSFNRANGAIGNGWGTVHGAGAIAGNQVHATVNWWSVFRLGDLPYTRQRVQMTLSVPTVGDGVTLYTRVSGSPWVTFNRAAFNIAADGITVDIAALVGGVPYNAASGPKQLCNPAGAVLAFQSDGNTHTAFVNGVQACQIVDGHNPSFPYYGFTLAQPTTYCDDFVASLPDLTSFGASAVAPTLTGLPWTINLTNNYGGWVAGTPGTPTFTVDSGTVVSQVVNSPNSATLYWQPTVDVNGITITDPSTLLTAPCAFVGGLSGGSGSIGLTQEALDWLNQSAAAGPGLLPGQATEVTSVLSGVEISGTWGDMVLGGKVVTQQMGPAPSAPADLIAVLQKLADASPPTDSSVLGQLLSIRGEADWTIQGLVNYLAASPSMNLQVIADAIAAIPPTDLQAVLDVLADIQTVNGYTLGTLRDFLYNLTSGGDYSLPTVQAHLDASIAAVTTAVEAARDSVKGASSRDLTQLYNLIGANGSGLTDILTAIANARGAGSPSIASALSDLLAAISGVRGSGAPDLALLKTALDNLETALSTDTGLIRGDISAARGSIEGKVDADKVVSDAIAASLSAYRTPSAYTVQHILDRFGDQGTNNAANVLSLIGLALLALSGNVAGAVLKVPAIIAGTGFTLAEVLDLVLNTADTIAEIIATINSLQPATPVAHAPIWPGLEGVEFGAEEVLDGSLNLAVPMDGCVINIDTPGEHPYAIRMTSPTRYGRLGVVSFMSDRNDQEAIQPVQYLNGIYTPRSLARAAGVVVQCKPGTRGYVRPWSLK